MDDWGKVKVQIYKHFLREPFLYYWTIITCFTFSLKRLLVRIILWRNNCVARQQFWS